MEGSYLLGKRESLDTPNVYIRYWSLPPVHLQMKKMHQHQGHVTVDQYHQITKQKPHIQASEPDKT